MSSKTVYVALEGALLSAPKAYLKIGEKGDVIVVPLSVLNNLYHFNGIKKVFASAVCDYLSRAELDKEFEQENGTFIRIMNSEFLKGQDFKTFSSIISVIDQRNLMLCKYLSENTYKDYDVILLSQNPVMLKYASSLGIRAKAVSDKLFPRPADRYTGLISLNVPDNIFESFNDFGKVCFYQDNLYENQFIILNNSLGGTLLGRYSNGTIYSLHYKDLARKVSPKNVEQTFLLEGLYAPPEIAPLVIASGAAGTGKTYTTMSAAFEQLQCSNKFSHNYNQIIISTPAITDVGESLGYLPGSIVEKLNPYFGGIFDALLKILKEDSVKANGCLGSKINKSDANSKLSSFLESGLIQVQPLGFLAGHSFEDSFVIVDEAQNIDPNFFINIITRISEGSKLVILGDPYQVKSSNLSRKMNGIVYMMEVWKEEGLAWQISMNSQKSLRSKLCQRAIELMT